MLPDESFLFPAGNFFCPQSKCFSVKIQIVVAWHFCICTKWISLKPYAVFSFLGDVWPVFVREWPIWILSGIDVLHLWRMAHLSIYRCRSRAVLFNTWLHQWISILTFYRVLSGAYFPVFGLNTGKYGPEKALYLDTFQTVEVFNFRFWKYVSTELSYYLFILSNFILRRYENSKNNNNSLHIKKLLFLRHHNP